MCKYMCISHTPLCVAYGLLCSYSMQQVIIGLDTTEMIKEMELPGPSEIEFGIEEIEGEDSDAEDDEEDEEEEDDSYDDVCFLFLVRFILDLSFKKMF